jgi:outer membrane protein insertion porin family
MRFLTSFFILFFGLTLHSNAQIIKDTVKPTGFDPELNAVMNGNPTEYTIANITTRGNVTFNQELLISISGLLAGDKVILPGGELFSKAITKLWEQRYFEDVNIYLTGIKGREINIEIVVSERPRVLNYIFKGTKNKSERVDLEEKLSLNQNRILTENLKRTAKEQIIKFYVEKSFVNVTVNVIEEKVPDNPEFNNLVFDINRGKKIKIDNINFAGNTSVSDAKLKKQLKGNKEKFKASFFRTDRSSVYEKVKKATLKNYVKNWGFLSVNKTRELLAPWLRVKLSSGKYSKKKFEEDKNAIIEYYNTIGHRDAIIEADTTYVTGASSMNIEFKVNEGRKYYFGDIKFKGNTKYADSVLSSIVNIKRGDIYNISVLNKRLGEELSPEGGTDVKGLYMDDGYLFFRVEPIETAINNDTIDYTIQITEGPQATIRNVTIAGNDKTKEYVIRRELRTVPGEKFSRADLIRSNRELAALNYFNQEKIGINPQPNPEDGTVDIAYTVEEKSSDQLELSAGWGGGVGVTGTLGVSFNNFSVKNIFKRSAWDPLPQGDGQKLSLRVQSNGKLFQSYNFSFTEPWLGGKKRNSFGISAFHNRTNSGGGYDSRGRFIASDNQYLRSTGVTVSLGKQLKWPDDYFSLVYSLNFVRYKLKNFQGLFKDYNTGISTNINLKMALARNSVDNPQFPSSGNSFLLSGSFTTPYSLLGIKPKADNQYSLPEFHKWRFNSEFYVPLTKGSGAEKNKRLVLKAAVKMGFIGRYNTDLVISPFERFQVGDAGLNNSFTPLGFDIIAHRGYFIYNNSNPKINPENVNNQSQEFFTIFNKYTLELRYPLSLSPTSTIYGLTFLEAANGWYSFKDYNPFQLRRSAGVGMRFFLPMFGLLGFDYGIGLDRVSQGIALKEASRFTFMLGFEPE